MTKSKTVIFIDGGFFLKRYRSLYDKERKQSAEEIAASLQQHCLYHLHPRSPWHKNGKGERNTDLLRIYVYDCPPLEKNVQKPISKQQEYLGNSDTAIFQNEWLKCLKKTRSVALRLGELDEKHGAWQIRRYVMQELIKKKREWSSLTDDDFRFYAKQKLVDVKLGSDITDIANKGIADRMVLIAGDRDFVPATKLARRQGIEVILDPMWNHVSEDLLEHIDRLHSVFKKS
ncbi:MAG: NYN domain-containing protein [Rhodobacteraceae bacterium]|nr:NYN domain-containing protein [Paracoccaceae bacterium]